MVFPTLKSLCTSSLSSVVADPPVGLEFRGFCSTAFLWDPSYGHRPVHVYDENGNMLEDLDQ